MTSLNDLPAALAPLEFLVFTLGAETYGVDIQQVQELRGYEAVTCIANAPAHIKGVVNLRGIIVPIIDLRMQFGQAAPRYDDMTVVVILNLGTRVVGAVVDGVSDVTVLEARHIKPPPQIDCDIGYVTGIATIDERILILVDMDNLLSSSSLIPLDTLSA